VLFARASVDSLPPGFTAEVALVVASMAGEGTLPSQVNVLSVAPGSVRVTVEVTHASEVRATPVWVGWLNANHRFDSVFVLPRRRTHTGGVPAATQASKRLLAQNLECCADWYFSKHSMFSELGPVAWVSLSTLLKPC
jgi:hypothetical protein